MEFTLLGAAVIGALGVYATLHFEAKRGNAADCSKNLWDVAMGAMATGLVVGRLAAMVADGVSPIAHPGDIIIVRAGVATGPASVAALGWVAWVARNELASVADGLAAAALAGLGGWHAGCLVRGACLGTTSDLPWTFAQPGSTISRHPVELYAALLLGLGAVVIARSKTNRPIPGVPAGLALVVAGAVRLITEPYRPSLAGGPVGWYLAAVAGGVIIIGWSRARASTPA